METMTTNTATGATFDAHELRQALAAVKPAVPKGGALPILTAVRIGTGPDGLTITATNLETTITATVPADVTAEFPTIAVPYSTMVDIFGKAPKSAGPAVIRTTGDDPAARSTAAIIFGGFTAEVRTMDAAEFPRVAVTVANELAPDFTLAGATLAEVATAASTDEARPVLTCVEFRGDTIVATDSYRLAYATLSTFVTDDDASKMVPSAAIRHAVKLAGKGGRVGVSWQDRDVVLTAGTVTITRRLYDGGEFPRWRGLIPVTFNIAATFDRATMLAAVKRLGAMVKREPNAPVRLTFTPDAITCHVVAQDIGRQDVTIPASVAGVGPDGLTVAYNPTYLADALTAGADGPDACVWHVNDAQKPAMVREHLCHASGDVNERGRLVMPVRIS